MSFIKRILCKFPLGVTSVSSGHPRLPAQSLAPVYIRLHRFRLPLAALQTFYHKGNFSICLIHREVIILVVTDTDEKITLQE